MTTFQDILNDLTPMETFFWIICSFNALFLLYIFFMWRAYKN